MIKIKCSCGKSYYQKQVWIHAACVTNQITNSITNELQKTQEKSSEVERVLDWRKNNPDRYREYQKEYMRQYRVKNASR